MTETNQTHQSTIAITALLYLLQTMLLLFMPRNRKTAIRI